MKTVLFEKKYWADIGFLKFLTAALLSFVLNPMLRT